MIKDNRNSLRVNFTGDIIFIRHIKSGIHISTCNDLSQHGVRFTASFPVETGEIISGDIMTDGWILIPLPVTSEFVRVEPVKESVFEISGEFISIDGNDIIKNSVSFF